MNYITHHHHQHPDLEPELSKAEVYMESQTKTKTQKFKKLVVGAEEASCSRWSSTQPPPKVLRCISCKCMFKSTPGYVTPEEEDNDAFQILTEIPEDTIEDDNVGLHHNHSCCA